ncbi:hypothetical protein [Aliikangiella sp. G2MR2-5]|uniref:hypothetical protein n=1 Tax=Aliikangiella sp. G2MR2-5 TaxID=2788943 RepID=UPI0018AC7224|nr:hypothetical protein [Aliikangiella sp. G2MR2-5]
MTEIIEFLKSEIKRSEETLSTEYNQAYIVGCSDDGQIAVFPCQLQIPFHYPKSISELESYDEPQHFIIDESNWNEEWLTVAEFEKDYETACLPENEEKFDELINDAINKRIMTLKEACVQLNVLKPIVFVQSESEYWFEVNTIHLAGPELPEMPEPSCDIEVLSRLLRHTVSAPQYSLKIENGVVTEVDLNGGSTNDSTIDLLRNIPNLSELLKGLKRINLESAAISTKSLDFLKTEIQDVELNYTPYKAN